MIVPVIQLFSSMISCLAILDTESGDPIRPKLCIFFEISRDIGFEIILDDKLGSYLDLDSTNKEPLIIRDILAHQSGLASWIPFYKQTLHTDSTSGLVSLRDTLYSKQYKDNFSVKVAKGVYLDSSYPDTIFQQIVISDLSDKKEYVYFDLGYYMFKELI